MYKFESVVSIDGGSGKDANHDMALTAAVADLSPSSLAIASKSGFPVACLTQLRRNSQSLSVEVEGAMLSDEC